MRACLATVVALSLIAGCAAVDHGRIAAHGDAAGTDWTIAPTDCLSGTAVTPPIDAVVFTSDSGAPAAIKFARDATQGEVVQIIRDVNGQNVTQTFQPSQCVVMNRGMSFTGWVVNGVRQMRVKSQIDCTADGVNVAGTVSFSSCGFSRAAASALTALAAVPSAEDSARLAQLPHIPASTPATAPTSLRGLSYRVEAHIVGAPGGSETVPQAEQSCAANTHKVLGPIGWTEVHDANSRVDLVVSLHCSGHVSFAVHGSTLEIIFPEGDEAAMTFSHDGVVIESVPRLSTRYLCDSSEKSEDGRVKDCLARFEQVAIARLWSVMGASQPLAALLRH